MSFSLNSFFRREYKHLIFPLQSGVLLSVTALLTLPGSFSSDGIYNGYALLSSFFSLHTFLVLPLPAALTLTHRVWKTMSPYAVRLRYKNRGSWWRHLQKQVFAIMCFYMLFLALCLSVLCLIFWRRLSFSFVFILFCAGKIFGLLSGLLLFSTLYLGFALFELHLLYVVILYLILTADYAFLVFLGNGFLVKHTMVFDAISVTNSVLCLYPYKVLNSILLLGLLLLFVCAFIQKVVLPKDWLGRETR